MDLGRKQFVTVVRWLSIALIVAALLMIVQSLPIGEAVEAMKSWIAGRGMWGPVVLVLLYVAATVLFVPGTILTLAAGAMFGLVVGMIAVSIGSTLGAAFAFLISRYLARDRIAEMAGRNRNFGAIDRAIGEGGWKIVALLRLSPAIPFNLQNYLYGLMQIRFWPYVLTSWLAMLPGTLLYVYLGHVTGAAIAPERSRTLGEWLMLAVGLLATVAVTVYITRLARRRLREHMDETTTDNETATGGHSDDSRTADSARSLRPAIMLPAIALAMVGAATYAYVSANTIERWFQEREWGAR